MSLTDLQKLGDNATRVGLVVSAVAPLSAQDGLGDGLQSVVLLSPDPKTFWSVYLTSDEAKDGQPDPIDRWSRNYVTKIAKHIGGLAVFPFDGPRYHPFSTWARRAGVAWQSPSGLLLHHVHGLWISFRGAVALRSFPDYPSAVASPCEECARPCLGTCPVGALSTDGFDYSACLEHVRSEAGKDCLNFGCRARRACPVGQEMAPPDRQLRSHMKAFTTSATP